MSLPPTVSSTASGLRRADAITLRSSAIWPGTVAGHEPDLPLQTTSRARCGPSTPSAMVAPVQPSGT